MLSYVLRRAGGIFLTLFVLVSLSFLIVRLAPGGPFDQEQALSAPVRANLERLYGLDQPLLVQYGRYLGALAHGDFGPSLRQRDYSVGELIAQGLPVSATLGLTAMVLALLLGVGAGITAAVWRSRGADLGLAAVTALLIALPSFVVGPLLALIFAVHLHWLPVAGWEPGSIRDLVLPVIALALPPLAYIARLTRGGMLEVLRSPFIRTAIAKGLPLHAVILRHALRPALVPVAGFVAPAVASIMTGSLVVESIAGLPGVGRYLVQGALNRDYTLVMGMVIIYSTALIGMGLIVDLVYAWLDPRVRYRR